MFRGYMTITKVFVLTILLCATLVVFSSIESIYAQPLIQLTSTHGSQIFDKPAELTIGVINVGNSTAKSIELDFVDVDDAFAFTLANGTIPDVLEPDGRVFLQYDVVGKKLSAHEFYTIASWQDDAGNTFKTNSTAASLYHSIFYNINQLPPSSSDMPNISIILIVSGTAIGAGVGVIAFIRRKSLVKKT